MSNYFSPSEKTDLANRIKTEKDAFNLKQTMDFKLRQPKPDQGFYSSPTYATVKKSYRASYPPSQRELYHPEMNAPQVHEGSSSRLPAARTGMPVDVTSARPRRSSLRQPTQFSGRPRSNSSPPKRVRFSVAETIYEPFDTRDVQTIDQILALLRVPSRKMSSSSSHSVVLDRMNAAHEYPEPISPVQGGARSVKPMHAELVDGYVHSQSCSRSHSARSSSRDLQLERPFSRTSSGVHHRSDSQHLTRSGSHYQTHSGSQSCSRSGIHSVPRGHTETPTSNRSSLDSEETLTGADTTWAPAMSIMLAKQRVQSQSVTDEDQPVVYSHKETNSLHRSDAQRLPKVPRRHKLLRNLTRMFD